MNKPCDGPMGVSQWREHGKKYGYDRYFGVEWPAEPNNKSNKVSVTTASPSEPDSPDELMEILERFEDFVTCEEWHIHDTDPTEFPEQNLDDNDHRSFDIDKAHAAIEAWRDRAILAELEALAGSHNWRVTLEGRLEHLNGEKE